MFVSITGTLQRVNYAGCFNLLIMLPCNPVEWNLRPFNCYI